MSQRELRALLADQSRDSSTRKRTRSATKSSRDMSEEERIAKLEAKLEEALKMINEQKVETEQRRVTCSCSSDIAMPRRL